MKELRILYEWTGKNRIPMIIAMAATIFGIGFSSLIPIVNQVAIDYVIQGDLTTENLLTRVVTNLNTFQTQLILCALIIVGLTASNAIFSFIQGRFAATASEGLAKDLKDRMYSHITDLPYLYHKRAETGDLIQRCTSDIENIRVFLQTQFVELGNCLFLFIIIFSLMLNLHVGYALVSVALVPILFLFSFQFFKKVRAAFKLTDEAEAQMSTMIQENLAGVRVVRAYNNETHEINKFEGYNDCFRRTSYEVSKLSSLFWASSDFLCFAQLVAIIIFGAYLVIAGQITIGVLQTFIVFGNMLIWPIRQLGSALTEFGKTTIAIRRIEEVFDQSTEYEDGLAKPEIKGTITFEKVGFEYLDEGEARILKDISFSVKKGETVAIIGKTGSGKSTLMNLLLRLYDYTEGSIKVDGVELKKIDKHYIRRQIGVVLQELFLYTKTIGTNIKIARKEAPMDEVHHAAKVASVHDVIESFEEGYDTMVGERGVTLSGGQKQRVGIARALMHTAPILIFDDSLSAVDTQTDISIREALKYRARDTTTFIIAHRVSTVKDADQIIVLDKGRIIQKGTHDQLIGQEGQYKKFWEIQDQKEANVMRLVGEH